MKTLLFLFLSAIALFAGCNWGPALSQVEAEEQAKTQLEKENYQDWTFSAFQENSEIDAYTLTGKAICSDTTYSFEFEWTYDEESESWKMKESDLENCNDFIKEKQSKGIADLQRLMVAIEFYFVDEEGYPNQPEGTCLIPNDPIMEALSIYLSGPLFDEEAAVNDSSLLCNGYPYYISYKEGTEYFITLAFSDAILKEGDRDWFCDIDVQSLTQLESIDELPALSTSSCEEGDVLYHFYTRK